MSDLLKPEQIRYRRDIWRLFVGIDTKDLGPIVEVGVAEGNFAEDMLKWPVPFPCVYLVDRWRHVSVPGDSAQPQIWHDKNRLRVLQRIEPYGDRARVIQRESTAAAEMFAAGELSYVNVDADHSYGAVRADANAWFPKLKKGGIISFHDYEVKAYGVKRAVNDFAASRNLRVYELPEDKQEDAGAFIIC